MYRTRESKRKMPAEWQQTNARRKALFRPWNLGLSMKRSRFDNKYVRLYENIVHRVGNRPIRCMEKSIREEMKKRKPLSSVSPIECSVNSA